MIKKAFYYLDDEPIKSVKFETDVDGQPVDKKVIYDNAPDNWDICKWDQGDLKPQRKKRKVEVIEELEIHDEIVDDSNE